ncbi:MAG TPA: hypothetical protein VGM04_02240 [Sphingomicrobium sp.]|jgi:hypothetical protein
MTARTAIWTAVAVAALGLVACKTTQAPAPAAAGETSAGTSATGDTTTGVAPATGGSGAGAPTIPTLVNVNLQNVLNNLSVSLKVNRDNIPVTAQVPIDVAANVCGVSVDALAAAVANGQAGCTATTTTPQLTQAVQQQIASGGSVTGGDQNMGTPAGAVQNNMM